MKQLLILFILIQIGFSQTENISDPFIDRIYKEAILSGQTYDLLGTLCAKYPKRLSGSDGAEGAIKWSKEQLEKMGFDRVYLQDVMVPFWERGAAEEAFTIKRDGSRISYELLALGRSVATPKKGISAPVILVNSLDEIHSLGREKVAGKIVFINKYFEQKHINSFQGYVATVKIRSKGPSLAAKYGAKAVIIRSVSTADDDFPHTGSLSYVDSLPKIPAAALGVQSAQKLEKQLKANPNLKLHLKINTKTHPDVPSHNVIAELKGSENPEKIILISGHIDAWDVGDGAHDDGAGVTHAMVAANTLKKLGYKPKNTIRVVLFINEENGVRGGKEYARVAVEKKEVHLAAIESDAGGFTPRGLSTDGTMAQLKKLQSFLPYFPDATIDYVVKGYSGVDITPLTRADKTCGIGLRPDSQRYFDFHHSAADVFSAVNKRELELGTASLATLIYLIDQKGL